MNRLAGDSYFSDKRSEKLIGLEHVPWWNFPERESFQSFGNALIQWVGNEPREEEWVEAEWISDGPPVEEWMVEKKADEEWSEEGRKN